MHNKLQNIVLVLACIALCMPTTCWAYQSFSAENEQWPSEEQVESFESTAETEQWPSDDEHVSSDTEHSSYVSSDDQNPSSEEEESLDDTDETESQESLLHRFMAGNEISSSENIQVPESVSDDVFFDTEHYKAVRQDGGVNPITGEITENDLKPFHGQMTISSRLHNGVYARTFTRGKVDIHPSFMQIDSDVQDHLTTIVRPVNKMPRTGTMATIQKHLATVISNHVNGNPSSTQEYTLSDMNVDDVDDFDADEDDSIDLDDMDETSLLQHTNTMEQLRQKGLILFSDHRDGVFMATCEFMKRHADRMDVGSFFSIPIGLFRVNHIASPTGQPEWKKGASISCNPTTSLPYHITCRKADVQEVVKSASVHTEITDLSPLTRYTETGEVQDYSANAQQSHNSRIVKEVLLDHKKFQTQQKMEGFVEDALEDIDELSWKATSDIARRNNILSPTAIQATKAFRDNVHDAASAMFDETIDDVFYSTETPEVEEDNEDPEEVGDFWGRRIGGFFRRVGRSIKRGFERLGNKIRSFVKRTWNRFSRTMRSAFDKVRSFTRKMVNTVKKIGRKMAKAFKTFVNKVKEAGKQFAKVMSKVAKRIGNAVAKIANKIKRTVLSIGKAIVKVGKLLYKLAKFMVDAIDGTASLDLEESLSVGFSVSNLNLSNHKDTYLDAATDKLKKDKEAKKKRDEALRKKGIDPKKFDADQKKKKAAKNKKDKRSRLEKLKAHADKEKKKHDSSTKQKKQEQKNKKKKKNKKSKNDKKTKKKKKKMPGQAAVSILVRIIQARVSIKPTLVLAIDLKNFKLKKAKVECRGKLDILLKSLIQLNAEWVLEKEKLVAEKQITRIKTMIGAVPVWITVKGQFYLGAALTIKAGIQFRYGGSVKGSWRIGASLDMAKPKGKRFSYVHKNEIKNTFGKPTGFRPCGSIEIEVFIRPQVQFALYDFAGPTFGLEPFATLEFVPAGATTCVAVVETHEKITQTQDNPEEEEKEEKNVITLSAGFRVKAGIQIGFGKEKWVDETIPLFEKSWELFSFELPGPRIDGNVQDASELSLEELADLPAFRNPRKQVHFVDPSISDESHQNSMENDTVHRISEKLTDKVVMASAMRHLTGTDQVSHRSKHFNINWHTYELDTFARLDEHLIRSKQIARHGHAWNLLQRAIRHERSKYNHWKSKFRADIEPSKLRQRAQYRRKLFEARRELVRHQNSHTVNKARFFAKKLRVLDLTLLRLSEFSREKKHQQHIIHKEMQLIQKRETEVEHHTRRARALINHAKTFERLAEHFSKTDNEQGKRTFEQMMKQTKHFMKLSRGESDKASHLANLITFASKLMRIAKDRMQMFNIATPGQANSEARRKVKAEIVRLIHTPRVMKLRKEMRQAFRGRALALRDLVRIHQVRRLPEQKKQKMLHDLRQVLVKTRLVLDNYYDVMQRIFAVATHSVQIKIPMEDPSSPSERMVERFGTHLQIVDLKHRKKQHLSNIKCYRASWWSSFDRKGSVKCRPGFTITQLFKSTCNGLHCLEEAVCCGYDNKDAPRYKANWWRSLDHRGWSKCKPGYAISGFFRNNCSGLNCLEEAYCTKMVSSQHCVLKHNTFQGKGWTSCPSGYAMHAVYRHARNGAGGLNDLSTIQCCPIKRI
eukprot:TRINITY_DN107_c0_g1_i11.p1 TRINITY_DN107_c0_g1~~TRINITY_DN107_c0_g1_i11.p1  ORF type:complete len:1631 (-),score=510.27 TRINITY_DN107_c0_g1_i11:1358-6250(-)